MPHRQPPLNILADARLTRDSLIFDAGLIVLPGLLISDSQLLGDVIVEIVLGKVGTESLENLDGLGPFLTRN